LVSFEEGKTEMLKSSDEKSEEEKIEGSKV